MIQNPKLVLLILHEISHRRKNRKTIFSLGIYFQIEPFDTLEEPRQKKRKKSEIKKAKPPTAEEISHLRETENVFHSNLFRLQIEEMLREIKLKESTYNQISAWIDKLKDFLLNIDFSFSVKVIQF